MALGEIGLSYNEYSDLSYRSFINVIKGYRSRVEKESNERLIIMRKIMYASLLPHLKKGAKETDIMLFDFEKNAVKKMTEEDFAVLEKEIEAVKAFWATQDNKA